ncbi:MAG: hypothetical protein H0U84_07305 [Thermoleophilaceae bacterium]|nr:hypothetical protein [Thermoleophilaceae bacterium]
MNTRLFWKALGVQAALVLTLFAVLVALPLDEDFFEDYGFVTGPAAWLACSFLTSRLLSLPTPFVVFAAVAGGVAGGIVFAVAGHWAGMAAALLVFGASCSGYDAAVDEAGSPSAQSE